MPSVDRNMSLLFSISVITALYWDMTGTLIPLFIRSLNASVFQANLVLSVGGLVATATMLPSGYLCDRYGRKRLMILGSAVMLASPFLYLVADNWEDTILCTVINMAAFSLLNPARMTMIADSVKTKNLGTAYGIMNLAWPIGGMMGPFVGGFIADNYGWTPFFYYVSLNGLICTCLSLALRESKKAFDEQKRAESGGKSSFDKTIMFALAAFLLFHFTMDTARGIVSAVFPFYLTETFYRSKTETGLFFSVGYGLATLITQFPSGILADRLGKKKTIIYSSVWIPFLTLLFPFTNNYVLTLGIYSAITALWSATWPASAAYLVALSSASKRGFMMGIRLAAVRLGFSVGPLIGGFLWDAFDPAISFYATAAMFAASLALALMLKE